MSFKIRLFYKLNNIILSGFKKDIVFNNLGYLRHTFNVKVPFEKTKFDLARPSVILPKFINITRRLNPIIKYIWIEPAFLYQSIIKLFNAE